jgi:S1-C subfamily serine protease
LAGLRAGDTITRVNGTPITALSAELRRVLSGSDTRQPLNLDVMRGDVTRSLRLVPATLSHVLQQAGALPGDDLSAPMTLLGYNAPIR